MHRAGELRHLITVYAAETVTNDLESDLKYTEQKKIWAKIVPAQGRLEPLDGDVQRIAATHKIIIRTGSLPNLRQEMYFLYRGQRYDVLYYMPVYNQRGWTEIFCEMTIEGENDGKQWF